MKCGFRVSFFLNCTCSDNDTRCCSLPLGHCKISDDEYQLVLEEVEKYRAMKEELRRKHTADSLVDEKTPPAVNVCMFTSGHVSLHDRSLCYI